MPMKSMTAPPLSAAPAVDAALANRRSLNANRRTAPPKAMPSTPVTAAPAGPKKPAWQLLREQGIAGQGSAAANKALAGNPAEMAIKGFAAKNPGLTEDFIRNAAGQPEGGGAAAGGWGMTGQFDPNLPPDAQTLGAPPGIQVGGPVRGGAPQPPVGGGPGGPGGGAPMSGMAPGGEMAGRQAQPFSPNLPPDLMARIKQLGPQDYMARGATPPGGPPTTAAGFGPGVQPPTGMQPPPPGLDQYFRGMQRPGGGQVYY